MTTSGVSRRYATFLALSAVIVIGLCLVGAVPTRRLAGPGGIPAMVAGTGIGFVSAALAGLLLASAPAETPDARMKRSFLGMIVRLSVVVVLGAAAVFSGELARVPLVFWIGTAYVALLPLEVRLAIL